MFADFVWGSLCWFGRMCKDALFERDSNNGKKETEEEFQEWCDNQW